jgi:hypothetical protein
MPTKIVFQTSRTAAAKGIEELATITTDLYGVEYLCSPSAHELEQIVELHKRESKVDGIFGSLD